MPPKKVVKVAVKQATPSPKKNAAAAPAKAAGKSAAKKGGGKGAQNQAEARSKEERISESEGEEEVDVPEIRTVSPRKSIVAVSSPSPKKNSVAKPSCFNIEYDLPERSGLSSLEDGLVRLRRSNQFCDVVVVSSSGRIPAHRIVLGAHSDKLASVLHAGQAELDLQPASQEAVELVVRWLYGEVSPTNFKPSTPKVNEEVLRITSELGLPLLAELCAMRLAEATNSTNLVASVRLCEDFGLPKLREKFVAAVVNDRLSLDVIARDPATLGHPVLMRELLAGIAAKGIIQ